MLKQVDLTHSQEYLKRELNIKWMDENKNEIKNKMDENKEEMKRNMEKMEQKMDGKLEQKILEALYGRLPKIDKGSKGTHENKGSVQVEQLSNNKNFPRGFNSNNGVTYGWSPKGVNLPKVELRKFDGTKVFTWVNQIEKYFELHNIMDDK
jgi:hypothetical protein